MQEKRTFKRIDISVLVKYKVQDKEKEIESMSIDLSGGGVQLLVNEAPPRGSSVELKMDIPRHVEPISARGEIVYSRVISGNKGSGGRRRLGIRFTKMDIHDREKIIKYVYECISDRRIRGVRDKD